MGNVRRIVLMGGFEEMHLVIMDERHLDNRSGREQFDLVLAKERRVCWRSEMNCHFAAVDVRTKMKCCVLCALWNR